MENWNTYLHCAAPGWLNDPNGLVFHDRQFEVYYQHNPDAPEWAQIGWGHARTRDFIHYEYLPDILRPDGDGMSYSGCCLVNEEGRIPDVPEGALVYYYTAASHTQEEAERGTGRAFTVRRACSTDGGITAVRLPGICMEVLAFENRDPKVFWHEESRAFIMAIFLDGHEYALARSADGIRFKLTQRLTFPEASEVPDLFALPAGEDGVKWIFWTADGIYSVGAFDGYTFTAQQPCRRAYAGFHCLAYAAQSFSGTGDRVIQLAWLKTACIGFRSTGMLSLPRQWSLQKDAAGYQLLQRLPDELISRMRYGGALDAGRTVRVEESSALAVRLCCGEERFALHFLDAEGKEIYAAGYHPDTGNLCLTSGEVTQLERIGHGIGDMELIVDRGVLEVSARGGALLDVLDCPQARGKVISAVRLSGSAEKAEWYFFTSQPSV